MDSKLLSIMEDLDFPLLTAAAYRRAIVTAKNQLKKRVVLDTLKASGEPDYIGALDSNGRTLQNPVENSLYTEYVHKAIYAELTRAEVGKDVQQRLAAIRPYLERDSDIEFPGGVGFWLTAMEFISHAHDEFQNIADMWAEQRRTNTLLEKQTKLLENLSVNARSTVPVQRGTPVSPELNKAINWLRENTASKLSVRQAAKAAGVSPTTFTRAKQAI